MENKRPLPTTTAFRRPAVVPLRQIKTSAAPPPPQALSAEGPIDEGAMHNRQATLSKLLQYGGPSRVIRKPLAPGAQQQQSAIGPKSNTAAFRPGPDSSSHIHRHSPAAGAQQTMQPDGQRRSGSLENQSSLSNVDPVKIPPAATAQPKREMPWTGYAAYLEKHGGKLMKPAASSGSGLAKATDTQQSPRASNEATQSQSSQRTPPPTSQSATDSATSLPRSSTAAQQQTQGSSPSFAIASRLGASPIRRASLSTLLDSPVGDAMHPGQATPGSTMKRVVMSSRLAHVESPHVVAAQPPAGKLSAASEVIAVKSVESSPSAAGEAAQQPTTNPTSSRSSVTGVQSKTERLSIPRATVDIAQAGSAGMSSDENSTLPPPPPADVDQRFRALMASFEQQRLSGETSDSVFAQATDVSAGLQSLVPTPSNVDSSSVLSTALPSTTAPARHSSSLASATMAAPATGDHGAYSSSPLALSRTSAESAEPSPIIPRGLLARSGLLDSPPEPSPAAPCLVQTATNFAVERASLHIHSAGHTPGTPTSLSYDTSTRYSQHARPAMTPSDLARPTLAQLAAMSPDYPSPVANSNINGTPAASTMISSSSSTPLAVLAEENARREAEVQRLQEELRAQEELLRQLTLELALPEVGANPSLADSAPSAPAGNEFTTMVAAEDMDSEPVPTLVREEAPASPESSSAVANQSVYIAVTSDADIEMPADDKPADGEVSDGSADSARQKSLANDCEDLTIAAPSTSALIHAVITTPQSASLASSVEHATPAGEAAGTALAKSVTTAQAVTASPFTFVAPEVPALVESEEALYCKACNQHFTASHHLQRHLKSAKHLNKVAKGQPKAAKRPAKNRAASPATDSEEDASLDISLADDTSESGEPVEDDDLNEEEEEVYEEASDASSSEDEAWSPTAEDAGEDVASESEEDDGDLRKKSRAAPRPRRQAPVKKAATTSKAGRSAKDKLVHVRSTPEEFWPLLDICLQADAVDFDTAFGGNHVLADVFKVGEGTFAEVFAVKEARARFAGAEPTAPTSMAFKIMPLGGSVLVNDEQQKSPHEMLAEVAATLRLSELATNAVAPGFIPVLGINLCRGAYPQQLLNAWDAWKEENDEECLNQRPDYFPEDQYYIVFAFENGGHHLEGTKLKSLSEAKSIFLQTLLALAAAEEHLQFEHRDLHWGNILLKATDQHELKYAVDGQELCVETCGIKVNIIDFTLSRLEVQGEGVFFCDLRQTEWLFEGKGDSQFDTYRSMRKATNDDWKQFAPKTNVLWLKYLLDKLMKETEYKAKSTSKAEKAVKAELTSLARRLKAAASAMAAVNTELQRGLLQDQGGATDSAEIDDDEV